MSKPVGQWLRERREELELSLAQVHLRTAGAVSTSTLSKVERGERPISPELLIALAPLYHVELDELYRMAGYLPGGGLPRALEPPRSTWEIIRDAIGRDRRLSAQQKRGILTVLREFFPEE